MPAIHHRRIAAIALAFSIAATACAQSDASNSNDSVPIGDSVPDTVAPDTAPPSAPADDTDVLDVEFDSAPVEAGPLFGSGDEINTEFTASCPDDAASECAELEREENSDIDVFEPVAVDIPFCSLLFEIEGRPFPSDDREELIVIRSWIGSLRDVAVDRIHADLDLLIESIDEVIESGDGVDGFSPSSEVLEASLQIEEYVEQACNGRGVPEVVVEPVDLPDDPELLDGVTIPVIEFADASDRDRPLFGEKDTSLFDDGFVRADEDQGFCTALDIVNSRPQPSEDLDEIRFVDGYLRALLPLVPDMLVEHVDTILSWTAGIIEVGDFTDEAEETFAVTIDPAVGAIDRFVDERCNGLS